MTSDSEDITVLFKTPEYSISNYYFPKQNPYEFIIFLDTFEIEPNEFDNNKSCIFYEFYDFESIYKNKLNLKSLPLFKELPSNIASVRYDLFLQLVDMINNDIEDTRFCESFHTTFKEEISDLNKQIIESNVELHEIKHTKKLKSKFLDIYGPRKTERNLFTLDDYYTELNSIYERIKENNRYPLKFFRDIINNGNISDKRMYNFIEHHIIIMNKMGCEVNFKIDYKDRTDYDMDYFVVDGNKYIEYHSKLDYSITFKLN